jgi:hypothetical protein
VPSLLATRALTSIATAEARRLYLRGEQPAALDLLLASYRFGSDISADPNGRLLNGLIGAESRRVAASGLMLWMKTDGQRFSIGLLDETARFIAQEERRVPSALEVFDREWQTGVLEIQDQLVHDKQIDRSSRTWQSANSYGQLIDIMPLPLRLRIWENYIKKREKLIESVRPALKEWDSVQLNRLIESARVDLRPKFPSLSVADFLSAPLNQIDFKHLNGTTLDMLYRDRARGTELWCFAAVIAFYKEHGTYPESIAQALEERKQLSLPNSLKGLTINYRLEHGQPVINIARSDSKN